MIDLICQPKSKVNVMLFAKAIILLKYRVIMIVGSPPKTSRPKTSQEFRWPRISRPNISLGGRVFPKPFTSQPNISHIGRLFPSGRVFPEWPFISRTFISQIFHMQSEGPFISHDHLLPRGRLFPKGHLFPGQQNN